MSLRLLFLLLALAIAATAYPLISGAFRGPGGAEARLLPVADGQREIAFLHTSTNTANWERIVAAVQVAAARMPGLRVDDSQAFPDRSTAAPQIVLSHVDRPGSLAIRWYKLAGGVGHEAWVKALAERDPAPLAILGGGSSDRAVDLAEALRGQTEWKGEPPVFLVTAATVNELDPLAYPHIPEGTRTLMDIYPGRSFRFCFHNLQMAEAVLDFLFHPPPGVDDVTPSSLPASAPATLIGLSPAPFGAPAVVAANAERPITSFAFAWSDDPYSVDLAEQFRAALADGWQEGRFPRVSTTTTTISYSVGRARQPNMNEGREVSRILEVLAEHPGERALLMLPTVAQPARRVLQALTTASPFVGKQLVVVNGDGLSLNNIYRDGDFVWNPRDVPVPLVFFAHQNPVAWETPQETGHETYKRSGTEDILLMADILQTTALACFRSPELPDADGLIAALKGLEPPLFDDKGDRRPGGEFVIRVHPDLTSEAGVGRVGRETLVEVFCRINGVWVKIPHSVRIPPEPKRGG